MTKLTNLPKNVTFPGHNRILQSKKPNLVSFGGVGSGKTHLGARKVALKVKQAPPNEILKIAVVAPSYKLLKKNHINYIRRALAEINLFENRHYRVNYTDLTISFYRKKIEIFFLSSDNYQSFVSWEFWFIWWDEPGFCSEELKRFIDERTGRTYEGQILYTGVVQKPNWYYESYGPHESLTVTEYYTLPSIVSKFAPAYEGYKSPRFRESESTLVLHSSSYENVFLNETYFARLQESYGYDKKMYEAHVLGLAVLLNKNSVYDKFEESASVLDCASLRDKVPHINVFMDFNYGQMSIGSMQKFENDYFVTWTNESRAHTTVDACKNFIDAFHPEKYHNFTIEVDGDQSGYSRNPQVRSKDGSYEIVKRILQPYYPNLKIKAARHTVPQESRVMSTNRLHAQAASGYGSGLYCDKRCKKLIAGWHRTEWDVSGKIKKGAKDDITHMPEGVDYALYRLEPDLRKQEVDYEQYLVNV